MRATPSSSSIIVPIALSLAIVALGLRAPAHSAEAGTPAARPAAEANDDGAPHDKKKAAKPTQGQPAKPAASPRRVREDEVNVGNDGIGVRIHRYGKVGRAYY